MAVSSIHATTANIASRISASSYRYVRDRAVAASNRLIKLEDSVAYDCEGSTKPAFATSNTGTQQSARRVGVIRVPPPVRPEDHRESAAKKTPPGGLAAGRPSHR